jgi:hypothetical protein
VAALRERVSKRRAHVRSLQEELSSASSQALFEVWKAARERLARLKELKRSRRGPPLPPGRAQGQGQGPQISNNGTAQAAASEQALADKEEEEQVCAEKLPPSRATSLRPVLKGLTDLLRFFRRP